MTLYSENEGRKTVKEYFTRQIALTKDRMNEYELKFQTTDSRNESTAMKAFYGSVQIACIQRIETLTILDGIIDLLFNHADAIAGGISKLDKTVQNIAEKTGVDISNVQTDIKELKETVGPNVKAVIQLFANLQKEEERRKKNGETMIV